jgi:hypothetical protein
MGPCAEAFLQIGQISVLVQATALLRSTWALKLRATQDGVDVVLANERFKPIPGGSKRFDGSKIQQIYTDPVQK